MLRSRSYLQLKPSSVGAAALLLAINLNTSGLVTKFGMKKLTDLRLKTLFYKGDDLINIEMVDGRLQPRKATSPL